MESSNNKLNVTVIGIGAMGGGMAQSLLKSSHIQSVTGYDKSTELCQSFHEKACAAQKQAHFLSNNQPPKSLSDAIHKDHTDVVVLVLVNEFQCEQVCFGENDENEKNVNVLSLLKKDSCVILCSTVTATWAKKASDIFWRTGNIHFLDCPISGGPVRAQKGELSLFASGSEIALEKTKTILHAMGDVKKNQVHTIPGGVGMGSTVKMIHQLLAGVHIVTAAEALALAAKAGIDVNQMYDIVCGAAGNSWMFEDRGSRMKEITTDVKSALNIFVKDLGIVHSEAKRIQSPIPIASAALQQFICGQSLGLGSKDDSQVVKVYENITGVSVANNSILAPPRKKAKIGDGIGDVWKLPDGTEHLIIEVGDEPRHKVTIKNDYTRVLKVNFAEGETTEAHLHAEDSLYFFLVEGGLNVINHVKGSDPECDCMDFGEIRYGTHKTDKPLVHMITNKTKGQRMFCIDAEILKRPPITNPIPLVAEKHELVKVRDKCRCYKLTLKPGESVCVSYPFFYLRTVLKGGSIKTELAVNGNDKNGGVGFGWEQEYKLGDVQWMEPCVNMKQTNIGDSVYEVYITEWC